MFILASSSPRRRELLASLGVDFTIYKPEIDEYKRTDETPQAYVERLSIEKAEAVAGQLAAADQLGGPALILAADTVVILAADTIGIETNGELLEKPRDADDARHMLRRLRGRAHLVVTAITLLRLGHPTKMLTRATSTTVHMRDYADDEIEAYIATGDPFDKAGSYAIQHEGFHPVDHIEGSYSNVVGLPLETLRAALADIGWSSDTATP